MARTIHILLVAIFLLHLVATKGDGKPQQPGQQPGAKKYCLPKPDANEKALQANIDYVCTKGIDCKPIQPGGACYEPNNVKAHASYVMNAFYNANGRNDFNCDFSKTAVLSSNNPSSGKCVYA